MAASNWDTNSPRWPMPLGVAVDESHCTGTVAQTVHFF
jgi:hypothetical protein